MTGAPMANSILSTLFTHDEPMEDWVAEVDTLEPRGALYPLELLRRSRGYRAVVLAGLSRPDQIAAAMISRRRNPPAIVFSDATWELGTHPADRIAMRLGLRAIDGPHVTYCVLSRFEVDRFPSTWGPLRGRVRFVPWAVTLPSKELARETGDNGRVFAGGDSLRNYRPLIAAARALDVPIDIASRTLDGQLRAGLPANVSAGPVSPTQYEQMLREASIVVLPLVVTRDRSSGQTTYLNAMALGKAVVVTDTPGVRDYIEDGSTGVIVRPDDSDAIAAAVRGLLADPERRRRIGARAREHVLGHFTLADHARGLLAAVHEAID
jgi:Glycosyl transferases group 1